MRNSFAVVSLILCAGCAGTGASHVEPSLGEQLSNNLLKAHEMYCSGSSEARERLSKLKQTSQPFQVVDRKTNQANKVWVVQSPVADSSSVKWGLSLTEPAAGNGCGVSYLKPEELETLKAGYLP